ncbi:MAG: hypothetical protein WKF87_19005 [Chryseolinea sp.]
MKKTIYILLIAFATAMTITSCTEEEVKPSTSMRNGGGGASDPK